MWAERVDAGRAGGGEGCHGQLEFFGLKSRDVWVMPVTSVLTMRTG